MFLAFFAANAWGGDKTSTLTFTTACSGSGTANDGVTWTVTSDASETTFDSSKGIHYGSSSKAVSYLTLTSASFDKRIKKVVVNCSDANKTAMVSVKVGGNAFGTSQQETAYNNSAYTFEPTTEQSATVYKGVIVVSLNRTSAKKALYVKSIAVTYEDSDEPAKTLSSIAISGTPTKTTYIEGDKFNPAGLVVTGTYSDESTAEITDGITWSFDPETLALGTTSVDITATVDGITSSVYTVNDLMVKELTYANTYTSGDKVNITTAGSTSGSPAKVIWDETEYDAFKSGSSSSAGSCTVTIPANTKILHFHAVGWKGEDVTLTVDGKSTTFNLVADDGVTNNSPFILQNDPETNDYFTFDPKGATSITLKATSGNRFVLFGVNAEMNEDTDQPIPDFIKTSSINLQVGDDAYDVSECLNIPDDYDTSVYSITTTINGLTEKDGEYACAYPYLSFQKAGTYTVHVIAAAIEGKYAQTEGDITVEVTAPAPKYLIKWSVNGEITKTETVEEGSAATAPEVTVPDGYTQKFMGWVTTETVDAETAPAYVTSFDTNADITYYAVFADEVGGSGSGDYKRVTTALTDWSGDYLIAYDKETFADGRIGGTSGMGKQYAKATPGATDWVDDNTIAATWGDTYKVTLVPVEGGYVMQTKDGNYNYQTKNDNGLASSANINTAAAYPITVNFVSADSINLALNGAATGAVFHYNTAGYFRFYKNGGQKAVYLYKKSGGSTYTGFTTLLQRETISIAAKAYDDKTNKYYGTYYSANNLVVGEDMTCAVVGVNDDKTKIVVNIFEPGDIIPANTGFMVSASAFGDHYMAVTTATPSALPGSNLLRGSIEKATTTGPDEDVTYLFYKLTFHDGENLGFWWGADNGAAFQNGAHKAYLAVPQDVAMQVRGFAFGDMETAISTVTTAESIAPLYDLQGRRISAPQHGGLYIQGGKKYIK